MLDDVDVTKYNEVYLGENIPQRQSEVIEKITKDIKNLSIFDPAIGIGYTFADSDWIIAGGYLRSLFTDTAVNDIDIFFTSDDAITRFKEAAVIGTSLNRYNVYWTTSSGLKYDFVIGKPYETPEELLSDFDIIVSQCAVMKNRLIYHADYFVDLATKSITFDEIKNPMNALIRTQKYIKYGFTASPDQLEILAKAIWEMDVEPIKPATFTDKQLADAIKQNPTIPITYNPHPHP
jgi:hypothetical protein